MKNEMPMDRKMDILVEVEFGRCKLLNRGTSIDVPSII